MNLLTSSGIVFMLLSAGILDFSFAVRSTASTRTQVHEKCMLLMLNRGVNFEQADFMCDCNLNHSARFNHNPDLTFEYCYRKSPQR